MTEEDQLEKLRKKPGRMNRSVRTNTNGNGWKPRKSEQFTCNSIDPDTGEKRVVTIMRPGPEFTIRAGRVARTFTRIPSPAEGETGLDVLANMDDEELAAVMIFARELVCAMLVSPRLVRNPRPGSGEIGPDDIGDDFWELFNYGMSNYFNIKVPVGDQEVEVSDLESFRAESSVSGNSVDGPEVRADAEQPVGN